VGSVFFAPDALGRAPERWRVREGCQPMSTRLKPFVLAALSLAALLLPASSASAQNGIFDSLFGRRWNGPPSANAYADPNSGWNPFGWRQQETARTEIGEGSAYCVRLCDGRFFPVQRHGGVTPAQVCSSFCPASQTRVYSGSSIEHAVAADGKPYRELATAFVYRDKIVPGCTCNGKDAFGLVNTPVEDDPTLRPGDIVATNNGLMAYNGGTKRQASFTPVQSYSGLSPDLRRKLTETKVAPAAETPAPPQIKPPEVKQGDGTARGAKNKRVQVDR
jgi:uncharacterized protein DUF2865